MPYPLGHRGDGDFPFESQPLKSTLALCSRDVCCVGHASFPSDEFADVCVWVSMCLCACLWVGKLSDGFWDRARRAPLDSWADCICFINLCWKLCVFVCCVCLCVCLLVVAASLIETYTLQTYARAKTTQKTTINHTLSTVRLSLGCVVALCEPEPWPLSWSIWCIHAYNRTYNLNAARVHRATRTHTHTNTQSYHNTHTHRVELACTSECVPNTLSILNLELYFV